MLTLIIMAPLIVIMFWIWDSFCCWLRLIIFFNTFQWNIQWTSRAPSQLVFQTTLHFPWCIHTDSNHTTACLSHSSSQVYQKSSCRNACRQTLQPLCLQTERVPSEADERGKRMNRHKVTGLQFHLAMLLLCPAHMNVGLNSRLK